MGFPLVVVLHEKHIFRFRNLMKFVSCTSTVFVGERMPLPHVPLLRGVPHPAEAAAGDHPRLHAQRVGSLMITDKE